MDKSKLRGKIASAITRTFVYAVGDANVAKSVKAILYSSFLALALKIAADIIYYGMIYTKDVNPAVNTYVSELTADVLISFATVAIAAYVAVSMAPAHPLRHALWSAMSYYLAIPMRFFLPWKVTPVWDLLLQVLAALSGIAVACGVFHLKRKWCKPTSYTERRNDMNLQGEEMTRPILWISVTKTAMVSALIMFCLAYPVVGLLWLMNQFDARPRTFEYLGGLVIFPVGLAMVSFVFAGLAAIFYNMLAKYGISVSIRIGPDSNLASAHQTQPTAD
jgi:hypothetical protein